VPAAQIWTLRPGFVFSDGSVDELLFFAAYVGFGLVCLILGVVLYWNGLMPQLFGPNRDFWLRIISMRIVGVPLILGAILVLNHRLDALRRVPPAVTSSGDEQRPLRDVDVKGPYRLTWQSRGSAPGLDWLVPEGMVATQRLAVTSDGPRMLVLRLPGFEGGTAQLTLHRDESTLDIHTRTGAKQGGTGGQFGVPYGFWIDRKHGWKLLGLMCENDAVENFPHLAPRVPGPRETVCFRPDFIMRRYLPGLFGLAPERWYAMRRDDGGCEIHFRVLERIVGFATADSCASPRHLTAVRGAMVLIDQLMRSSPSRDG
jgi:hypothetical protein